ncbi:right-handed parallel beta-helix repeat-containing protein [Prosthecobacter sp.]|uniref:right-handed parallel beta-helix repeat-containing protein n=1 Tax=Prosthecobacter sp. TaxID=1965333 RepID=UPI002AB9B933|nr:right-handed parallel beta-helix repeat-containing protein [Prosthecobacter sp.]MDZ4404283.1 right-handed parallel beta-helix repeat-containing protein [Prosthecobacter sp.]
MIRSCCLLLFFVCAASATDLTLKPGNLAAVLEQARKAPKPVRIIVEDGVHPITETITLGKDDSQVTWSGKNAIFMAGKPITGWVKEGVKWKALLPDKAWKFEQLWINGRRATLARSPNKGYHHITEAVGAGVFPDLKENMNFHAFSIPAEQFEVLKAIPQAERDDVLLTVTHAWAVGQCRIKALNDEALAVQIKGRSRYPFVEFEPDQRFWMENYRAALDAPGEWFLDKAKGEVLYLPLPGEDMPKAEVIAPLVTKFIVMKGAHDVRFEGISFQYSQHLYPADGLHDGQAATTSDGCIEIEDSRGIQFENCEIAHTGLHGIWFKNGCANSSVKHCHLHDLGGGGVYVGETKRPEDERVNHHIIVDDCIMQHGGRLHPSACGVVFTHTQHCAVTHCDIGDFYYTGISAGWNWGYGDTASRETLVENNHIHHLGWAYLSDMGGFYGLGTSPGTIIRGNHVHHIASHRYGGWGLYNDEGASDTLMENNLVHDTWNAGFHQHYGYFNTVRNNIFAFGNSAQIQASRNEARLRFRYMNNIVVWDPASPLLDGGEWNWKFFDKTERGDPKDSLVFRKNLYWPTDGKIPALLTKTKFTWDEWRKMGRDNGSRFADPMFENIAKRDFRLKPGSPAEKLGFKPWDLTLAGVHKTDAKWHELAAKGHDYPTWETEAKPWPAPPYKVDQNFERIALGMIGVRGAKYGSENKGESIGVTDEVSSPIPSGSGKTTVNNGQPLQTTANFLSKRSLKVQDAPGLKHSYDPVLDIYPKWESGTFHVSFDIMAQPGADWFFEMRAGNGGEFAAGPYIRWQKGILVANVTASHKLAELKPGEWLRIEITATTGGAKYDVTLTRQDGTKTDFKSIPCKPTWTNASYMLFSSLGTTKTALFIDNVKLEQR